MAQRIKIASGILNIALHPHTPDLYRAFLRDAYALKMPIKVRGERYAVLSLLERQESQDGFISGLITTFTRIDRNGAWFDTTSLAEASDNQVSKINIPDGLFPNSAAFYFSFNVHKHRLFFQTYSKGKQLTVSSALRLFQGLADDLSMLEKYPSPKITPVQSHAGLSTLFALKKIKEIKITILRPNPDLFDDNFETEIEAELEASQSKKVVIAFEAEPGRSVIPTPAIRKASEAALESGRVDVRGRDDNGAVNRSTEDFPRILQDKYDPDEQSESDAFRGLIRR